MRILIVEDETDLADAVARGLKRCGYAVDTVYSGEEGLVLAQDNAYDLVVLDLNLPGLDGMDLLRELRLGNKEVRVLIVSARCEIDDKIEGLDWGANDYLTKPFDFRELEARVRSLLRRSFIQQDTELLFGGLHLNTAQHRVSLDGFDIELTNKEFAILEYLMLHQDRAVRTEELIEHVWDENVDMFTGAVKVHIHALKKKLAPQQGVTIKNVRGVGYIMAMCEEG